ncbi:mDRWMS2 [Capsaspora owczarzaki ATCC 30864]|uniref:mDRWMS2 n=1 Tax=Capsaspora owczarzaki (strain ATCC 30864) TaxID=595528 RepID=UPI000352191B|nr:mDRWMS2 [Capsaspora owczarzaki ATCC 30864]|eukprot:XP_004349903.2 mDRWMS2 [Capsaspora owczarzaki ATCC 30864]
MSSGLQFTLTPNLRKAVLAINQVDASKFPRILLRVSQKLHLKDVKSFTEIEEQQLQEALGLSAESIALLLETSAFVLEQSAYHAAKPDALAAQLRAIELDDDKVEAFIAVWRKEGPQIVTRLRDFSLHPDKVDAVNWSLHLQMAQASAAKVKATSAILELQVAHDSTPKRPTERIHVEFSHDELFAFYNNLEIIQEQLDQLS